jgi:hypothetical protein
VSGPHDKNSSGIDLQELENHLTRLGQVRDRVVTAADAGAHPVEPMAFGLFGAGYGMDCEDFRAQCHEVLQEAVQETNRHLDEVRRWHDDVDLTQQEMVDRFEGLGDELR